MSVLTDIKNRHVTDVNFGVCDGLKGHSDVVANTWPLTILQTCIIHLIRNTFGVGFKEGLGRVEAGCEADRHRTPPPGSEGRAGCSGRQMGQHVRGGHQVVEQRTGG